MPFPDDMGSFMFVYLFIYLIIIYTVKKKSIHQVQKIPTQLLIS